MSTGDDRDPDEQARVDILSLVSHDLRNPLGSIMTSIAMIMRLDVPAPANEKLRKYAGIIQRASDRMNRWITDVFDLALLEGGLLPLQRTDVEARALAAKVVDDLRPLAAEKNITLDCEIEGDPGTVHADRDRMSQAIACLVGAALEVTPGGGAIMVGVRRADGVPTFSVRDTGPGLAPQQIEKIFVRYWEARRERGSGVVLGYALARAFVEAHGGRFSVASTPGEGTTFTFTCPRGA
jgi:signal transduction histidine kinase